MFIGAWGNDGSRWWVGLHWTENKFSFIWGILKIFLLLYGYHLWHNFYPNSFDKHVLLGQGLDKTSLMIKSTQVKDMITEKGELQFK